LFTDSAKSFEEAGFADRLEQIVKGVHLEGSERVLVVRGDKDDARNWEFVGRKVFDHPEAVHPGHLDIKKDEVWMELFDRGDGGFAAIGLRNDLNSLLLTEQAKDFSA
jgi:hypothetical protein